MTETRVFQQGLQLMAQSPFQRSLSPDFMNSLKGKTPEIATHDASSEESLRFSDATRFVKQRCPLVDARDAEVHSRATTTYTHLLSPQLQQEVTDAQDGSYLKLDVLAENAIAQVSQDVKLVTLPELNSLKKQIQALDETRSEIQSQLTTNYKLIEQTFASSSRSQEDQQIVSTIISSNSALTDRLFEVSKELNDKERLLRDQYLLAISFMHMDYMTLQGAEQTQQLQSQQRYSEDRRNDELLSYIASAAVQRNIPLPPPSGDSSEQKTEWARLCLETLLDTPSPTPTTGAKSSSLLTNGSVEKSKEQVYKLKMALQDLQFAHNYLTKQYETERSMNTTISDTHKNKRLGLENKLSETVISLEKANQRSILIEHEKNVVEAKLHDLNKDFQELQRRFTQLKIDNFGYIQGASPLSPISDKENSPTSPMTGLSVSLDHQSGNGNTEQHTLDPHPKTPLLQQSLNNSKYTPNGTPTSSSMKYTSSISVMRGEFKKLVKEMQNGYEVELEKEKDERQRLEQLVKMLEQRSSDNDDLL